MLARAGFRRGGLTSLLGSRLDNLSLTTGNAGGLVSEVWYGIIRMTRNAAPYMPSTKSPKVRSLGRRGGPAKIGLVIANISPASS